MTNDKRPSLSLDDDIDISSLVKPSNTVKTSPETIDALVEEGKKTGFVSREAKESEQGTTRSRRKVSPYTVQKNIKMRVGMADLLEEITYSLDSHSDQATVEVAILALIQKEELTELEKKFHEIVPRKRR